MKFPWEIGWSARHDAAGYPVTANERKRRHKRLLRPRKALAAAPLAGLLGIGGFRT